MGHLRARRARNPRGFSLLEVMISVAILGLALTVILSAQGGLSASNRTAENQSVAAGLVRCHMTELEERLLKLGYPEIDEITVDAPCCNEVRNERFLCDHRIEKIELPLPASGGAGDAGLSLSTIGSGNTISSGLSLDGGSLSGMGTSLMSQMGVGGENGAGGLLDMVMGMVYPSLKPMMEMAIRRVSVIVRWREGINPREIEIVQFVTNPARAGMMQGDMFGDAGVPALGDGGAGPVAPTGSGATNPAGGRAGGGLF